MDIKTYPWQAELLASLNALRDRLPNGILLYGPRGIGTFEAACAFAASLLCTSPAPDGRPCGHCKGCRLFAADNHPDIRYIVSEFECVSHGMEFAMPETNPDKKTLTREILINQTRDLGEYFSLKSNEGGVRVVIVYPADKIRSEAAASLLKNLEEPPENTIFILVADEIDRVLATIRSRCRLIRAKAPAKEQALAWLQSQGVKNAEQKLTEAAGMPLSALAEDPRYAMSEEGKRKILAVLAKGAQATAADALNAVDKDMTIAAAALVFSRWAWDLASVRAGAGARYFPSYEAELKHAAESASSAGLYQWINSVRDVRRVAEHTLNAKAIIEAVLLSYARCLAKA